MFFTISALIIIFIAIIISQFLIEAKLQPVFWMIALLLFVCYANIYMAIYYYVKLRNNPGIQGRRGNPGLKGSTGSQGVCIIDTGCDALQNCNELIERTLREKLPEYDAISKKKEKGRRLSNKDKKIIQGIQTYKSILLVKCESGRYTRQEFKDIVTDSLDTALEY